MESQSRSYLRVAGRLAVYEFYRMMPEGFLFMNTTGRIRKLADDHIKNQMDFIEDASIDLEQSGPMSSLPAARRSGP